MSHVSAQRRSNLLCNTACGFIETETCRQRYELGDESVFVCGCAHAPRNTHVREKASVRLEEVLWAV